ncbi:mannose-binding protein C-like [Centroberyx gerrardi]
MKLCLLFCVLSLLAPLGHSQLQGPPGPKGDRGLPGFTGLMGAKGEMGGSFTWLPVARIKFKTLVLPYKGCLDLRDQGEHLDQLDHKENLDQLGYEDHVYQDNAIQVEYTFHQINSTSSEFEALKNSIAKLELAVNYDFIRKAGQKYFVSYKERNSFSEAAEFCSQRGLELALPQNDEENNILTQFFGTVYKEAWINVNNKKAEGNFETDMKNRPLTFTKWGEGQPDRSIGDTGCTKVSDTGVWQVTKECFINAFIICEL